MKIAGYLATGLLLAVSAFAQDTPTTLPAVLVPDRIYQEVKQFLTLTDAQLNSLQQILNEHRQANSAVYTQMNQRQQTLNQLLESGSQDAAQIGRLMVEINNLRKQVPVEAGPYRTRALAVLSDAQKAKLPALADALRLATPAWQASSLLLIESPEPQVRPLPAFLGGVAMDTAQQPAGPASSN